MGSRSETLDRVVESAARLQQMVPDAVLVGGAAAAYYADHRDSFDHGHVLSDLADRYEQVPEAVEATDGWVTSVRASRPPFTLMGSLGGVEAGLRQLRRARPLEVTAVDIPDAGELHVPTLAEILRIKAYLVVQRNQVRDLIQGPGRALARLVRGRRSLPRTRRRTPGSGRGVAVTAPVRNVDVPNDDIEAWPYEAIVATIERGTISDWARIGKAIAAAPCGDVTRQVEDYLEYADDPAVAALLRRRIARARAETERLERRAVAAQVREFVGRSGLSRDQFARRIGTSRTRLSTYCSGKVTPSAALMLRMSRVPEDG